MKPIILPVISAHQIYNLKEKWHIIKNPTARVHWVFQINSKNYDDQDIKYRYSYALYCSSDT